MNDFNPLIWQYKGKPKAVKTVQGFHDEFTKIFSSAIELGGCLDIDKATGVNLNLVGYRVGVSRTTENFIPKDYFGWFEDVDAKPFDTGVFYEFGESTTKSTTLDDDDYRFLIKAKVTKNYQDGTIENLTNSVKYMFGDSAFIIDNLDMTMNIAVNEIDLTDFRMYAVKNLDIIARPCGVNYQFIVVTNEHAFGWYEDDYAFGFDDGIFVEIVDAS